MPLTPEQTEKIVDRFVANFDGVPPFREAIRRALTTSGLIEAVEALDFYQDSFGPTKAKHGLEWRPKEALLDDCGNIARAALTKILEG